MQAFEISTLVSLPRLAGLLVCGCLMFGLSAMAVAAPPPTVGGGGSGPEQEACAGRAVGDACTMPNRQLGTCGQGTCNRLDYSQGSPPRSIEESCVVCQPAGAGHQDHPTLGTGGAPPDDGGTANTASDTASNASSGSGKEPPQSSSRCQVGDGDAGLIGLAMLSLLGLARRRPRPA